MEKVKLKVIGLAPNPFRKEAFLLLLGEVGGTRHLPILVGIREAQAIALALDEEQLDRPMPHDLLGGVLMQLGYTVEDVVIDDLKDQVFFAKMVLSNGYNTVTVDARPSDAIAVGLRFKADFWIDEVLLDQLCTVAQQEGKSSESTQKAITAYSIGALKELLQEAVAQEEYEKAALIRDELTRRTKQ